MGFPPGRGQRAPVGAHRWPHPLARVCLMPACPFSQLTALHLSLLRIIASSVLAICCLPLPRHLRASVQGSVRVGAVLSAHSAPSPSPARRLSAAPATRDPAARPGREPSYQGPNRSGEGPFPTPYPGFVCRTQLGRGQPGPLFCPVHPRTVAECGMQDSPEPWGNQACAPRSLGTRVYLVLTGILGPGS